MNVDSLMKLYVHELKDLHSAERQIVQALPKMIKAAGDDKLRTGLEDHLEETKNHVKRLEKIFSGLEYAPGGHKCKGMEGLLEEGEDSLKDAEGDIVDAVIIAGCQRVEHYEIAGYGTARSLARHLGREDDAKLLGQTLEEESAADEKLTKVAEERVNPVAAGR